MVLKHIIMRPTKSISYMRISIHVTHLSSPKISNKFLSSSQSEPLALIFILGVGNGHIRCGGGKFTYC